MQVQAQENSCLCFVTGSTRCPQDWPSPSAPFQHPTRPASGRNRAPGTAGASLAWSASPTSYSLSSAQWCSAAFGSSCTQARGRHISKSLKKQALRLSWYPSSLYQGGGMTQVLRHKHLSASQGTEAKGSQLEDGSCDGCRTWGAVCPYHSTTELAETPVPAFLFRTLHLGFTPSCT